MTIHHRHQRSSSQSKHAALPALRARLGRSVVLFGAVGMLAACGPSAPSAGEVPTAALPATTLPTLEATPSVTLEPTEEAPDATGTTTGATGTPATDTTGTTTGATGTPATDTTGTTTGATGTPATDTTGTTTGATGTPTTNTTGTTTGATGTPATATTGTPAIDTTGTPATGTTTAPVGDDASVTQVTIEELMEDPTAYLEQQVMVESTVQALYNPIGVQLGDETTTGAGNRTMLMVVGEERLFADSTDWFDAPVQVMGTLYEFNQAEFEREWDWFDADAAWVAQVEEGQPILIADAITAANE